MSGKRQARIVLNANIPVVLAEDVFQPKGTCYHINPDGRECGQPTTTLLCEEHTP